MKTGTELIAIERERQIKEEGWTAEHDDGEYHEHGEMAMVACCYASPILLYAKQQTSSGNYISFQELYRLTQWDIKWDKRVTPNAYLDIEPRIRNLVKAGALIAAEIDRLQRLQK